MSGKLVKEQEKRRKDRESDLQETIESTIRQSGPMNTIAWAAVVIGAFLFNLLLLMLVAQPQ